MDFTVHGPYHHLELIFPVCPTPSSLLKLVHSQVSAPVSKMYWFHYTYLIRWCITIGSGGSSKALRRCGISLNFMRLHSKIYKTKESFSHHHFLDTNHSIISNQKSMIQCTLWQWIFVGVYSCQSTIFFVFCRTKFCNCKRLVFSCWVLIFPIFGKSHLIEIIPFLHFSIKLQAIY